MADKKMIDRDWLQRPYVAFVSTGPARATRMLEISRGTRPARTKHGANGQARWPHPAQIGYAAHWAQTSVGHKA